MSDVTPSEVCGPMISQGTHTEKVDRGGGVGVQALSHTMTTPKKNHPKIKVDE